jgi:uncharacterized repeat protein (TIGR03803 family)
MLRRNTKFLFALTALVLVIGVSCPVQSQTYQVIYNFTDKGSDGATPYGGPILDKAGNLYGTTYLGGKYGSGSVYELSPNGATWTYQSLYSFKGNKDGAGPAFGSLVMDTTGALYGTTEGGGYFGTAFEVCACTPVETVIHRFGQGTDGAQPIGGLTMDEKGNLYGTTSLGGANGNGTVFEAKRGAKSWTEKNIYSFAIANDGINPPAGPTYAQGELYGTASFGGIYDWGAVYELGHSASGWTETLIYNFQGLDDGQNPVGGVIADAAGNLYGTTFDGGVNGGGTVYELSPSGSGWTFTTIYSFTGGYGGPYNKLTFDGKGNLYGFTNAEGANGLGSVFKLTPGSGGWTFTDLYDFVGGDSGGSPYGSVAVDAKGNIFGTAVIGGTSNQGVVYEITP